MKGLKVITIALALVINISCSSSEMDPEVATAAAAAAAEEAGLTKLAVGDDAPLFTLPGTPGKADISLAEAIKEKPVLLAFYPKAFTGG